MALVSVVVPCFNASKTILQTLNSIKNQEMEDFECIIINDFSSDNTAKIITKFSQLDSRFKTINMGSNRGVSVARNKGLEKSSGRYITFLDSDDMWHRNFLKSSIDVRKGNDLPITQCPYVRFLKKEKHYNTFSLRTFKSPKVLNFSKKNLKVLLIIMLRNCINFIFF